MAFALKLCFATILLLVLVQEGKTLKCYQCTSDLNGICDEPLNTTQVKIQTCSSPHNSCLLLNVTEEGETQIRRECAEANYCDNTRNKRQVVSYSRSCNTCSWGLCNSSPSVLPSFAVGIVGLLFLKYFL